MPRKCVIDLVATTAKNNRARRGKVIRRNILSTPARLVTRTEQSTEQSIEQSVEQSIGSESVDEHFTLADEVAEI